MNYEKLYFAFIEKYKSQEIDKGVYTEKHHIIPRHAGGGDSKDNIITLTFRQHVFAHRLLWKAYKSHNDLIAWYMMSGVEVDKKLASLKAIGRANVESGFLDSIRHMANNAAQKQHARELAQYRKETDYFIRLSEIGLAVWRGSSHTDEWRKLKSIQMKEWSEREDNYKRLLEMNKKRGQLSAEKTLEFSKQLIINAERNEEFLQETSSRSKNIFISPEGLEFDSPIFAAKYYGNVEAYIIENWCKRNKYGWSRKPKQSKPNELA